MTTKPHTELAAQARALATKSSKMGTRVFAEEIITCLRACAAALESPERVTKEMWKNAAENALELAQSLTTTPPERVQVEAKAWATLFNGEVSQMFKGPDAEYAAKRELARLNHEYPADEHKRCAAPLFTTPPTAPAQDAQSVKLPTGEDEAALMVLLGTNWLEQNAPHRLKATPSKQEAPAGANPWQELFWEVAKELNCLPSSFVDANEHVIRAARKLAALRASSPVEPREQRWLCLLCKSDTPGRHGTLDDRKTPCPNGIITKESST